MRIGRTTTRALIGAGVATVALISAMPAADASPRLKTGSLAQVLARDTSGFDRNPGDFDILSAAVTAVLKAKPNSPVKVLADGKTPVTAFLPDDRAFEILVQQLTGSHKLPSEQKTFTAVAGLGINTVETVLLYHVVPGVTIDRRAALKANGKSLTTAQGGKIRVTVVGCWWSRTIQLRDADPNLRNPKVIKFDVNKGNQQIGHVIDRVLVPVSKL